MNTEINIPLSILFVDDSTYKIEKVENYLGLVIPNSKVTIAKDRISALTHLEVQKFDLLLLDMQLPNRFGESEPDEQGGVILLEEFESSENYIHPTRIIAFTEFDDLQEKIRISFPELGAIKFDPSSDEWKNVLFRILNSLAKSKNKIKKVVYCEGNNNLIYNNIGLIGIEFWALNNSRAVYLAAKNESDKFSLRDRDFLTSNEIKTLTNKPYFENYIILEYYCVENYLYHPDNISEAISGFNRTTYLNEIIKQKNEKLESIIQDYKLARVGYTDFTDNDKKTMDNNPGDEIISSLKSDELEVFYKFFDMAGKKDQGFKKSFNKKYLESYNIDEISLTKTHWFKQKISYLLTKIV